MKSKFIYTILILFLLSTLFCTHLLAIDYSELNLPKGAKARIGKGVILDIQISPNNTRLAVASSIGSWLYDISTDKQFAPIIKFEKLSVSKIAFSPDSTKLAVSSPDLPIQIWNVENGEVVFTFTESKGALISLEFTENGNTPVSLYQTGVIKVWDTINGIEIDSFSTIKPKISIKGNHFIRPLSLHVDDNTFTVANGNMDGSISIKDGKSGRNINKLTSKSDIGLSLPIYYREEDTLEKHPKSDKYPLKWVHEIDFSKDGNTLFTYSNLINVKWHSVGGTSGPSEVWDVKTGQQLASLKTHVSIQTSSNSKTIALIGHKSCEIWDIKTKRKITEFPNVKIIRFSGDGKTYAIIGKDFYALWDIASQSEIILHRSILEWVENPPEEYFLSYDGTLLATADENGTIALWETRNSKRKRSLITGYAKPFFSLAFAEDSNSLATLDLAKNIHVWDISNHKKTQSIKTGYLNRGRITYSQNDKTLICESEGMIKKWDISSGLLNDTFTIPDASLVLFSASFDDGTHLNIHGTSVFSKKNNTLLIETRNGIEVWDIHTQKRLNSFEKVKQTVSVSILSNNEHKLAVSSGYDVRLWDTHTQNEYATLKMPMSLKEKISQLLRFKFYRIYSLALSPDGKILAVGTNEKRIHIWDITSRSIIKTLHDQKYVSSQLVFSPDGKLLASGDTGGLIHLWEVPSYKHVATYDGYKNSIRSLIFSPDGKSLASTNIGDYSGTILLWNIPSK